MKTLVVGLGVQGRKRRQIAGADLAATVDPVNPEATYRSIQDVPLSSFESALVCTPDDTKFEILSYLLVNHKHVLVEKPLLSTDSAQIKALAALAHSSQVACYTAYNHRFEPHIERLKQLLDDKGLGKLYRVSMFYGNGTARDVRNSVWRDKGMGVISDLGSHMLDLVRYLIGGSEFSFRLWSSSCFENRAPDHAIFGAKSADMLITLEGTLLSWRNTFRLDVLAEEGSAHVDCLCKWGPSTLIIRKRVLPSGRPSEDQVILEQPDPTWSMEYEHFKSLCGRGMSNLENDAWINDSLNRLFAETKERP